MSAKTKKILSDSIKHKSTDKIPTMYRGEPSVNQKLIEYFNLGKLEDNWGKLVECLGADNYSDGETLGGFTTYFPDYIGPDFKSIFEVNRFDVWGIKPIEIYTGNERNIVFSKNPPLYSKDEITDLHKYEYPKIEWFDFSIYRNNTEQILYGSFKDQEAVKVSDLRKSNDYFLNTSCMNSIFMVSTYLRGMDKMFMDLLSNKRYAETLLGNIGQFMVEFNRVNLKNIGNKIDLFGIWDDFADQESLMISPEIWRKYYKSWYVQLINEAKKYNLLVCFHICGSCIEIIPDLIEMGVDILDPVQVSAKDMGLENLKKKFGRDICFHGGLDAQKFLPFAKPEDIKNEVKKIKEMFMGDGGIILGPSHYLTNDIPIKNILAIYQDK